MRPISPNAESDGRVTRLYAAPRWIPVDGVLVPIEQAVTIHHDPATESYRVQFGKESIELRPNDPAAMKAAITGRRTGLAFGPILDPLKAPAAVGFTITHSDGVVATTSGWRFKDADVPVGLFIGDWRREFRDKCTVAANAVTLDLTEAKEKALARGSGLNLDPTVVDVDTAAHHGLDSYGYFENVWGAAQSEWAGSELYDVMLEGYGVDPEGCGEWTFARQILRFNTVGHPSPLSAYLYLEASWTNTEVDDFWVMRLPTLLSPLTNSANWPKMVDSYGGPAVGIGSFEKVGGSATFGRVNVLSRWQESATFDLGIVHNADHVGDYPGWETRNESMIISTNSPPYLEIVMAGGEAGGGRLTLLGVGT